MAFLEVSHLSKVYPDKRALPWQRQKDGFAAVDDVSFVIEKGEFLGLVGESGCGKSTLSRLILQLLEPSGGSVRLAGQELSRGSSRRQRLQRLDFQMIFQDPHASLNPRLSVFATLAEALRQRQPQLRGPALRQAVIELLQSCGLDAHAADRYPHSFSGGQRQRIAIARALAPRPQLIIADEPVSALDVSIQSQILMLLLDLRQRLDLTVLFISHDMGVIRYVADRVMVMEKGRIVEQNTTEELFLHPRHPYTQRLLAAIPRLPQGQHRQEMASARDRAATDATTN